MKKRNLIFLMIILLGALIGLISGLVGFPTILFIFVSIIVVGIISIITFFIGIIKSNKLADYGIVILISTVVVFLSMKTTIKVLDNYQQNKAEKIIVKIENYKAMNGKAPEGLKVISSENEFKTLKYSVEKNLNHFTLEYTIDGWNYKLYKSRTRKWEVVD